MKKFEIIKVDPQGYCGGVLKAISIAKNARLENPDTRITILGNLVHNQYVKKALAYYKLDTIDNKDKTRVELLDEIDDGIVIFTAHGVSNEVHTKAEKKGLKIIDASCPFVLQTQKIIKEKLENGYIIFYIGKYKHPEAEAIYSTSDDIYLIEKKEDIPLNINKNIFVTNQTTMSIFDIKHLFEDIKNIYPSAIFHDELCNATRVRQQAILDLKDKDIDTLIVVGDPTSNNTRQLANIGTKAKIKQVIRINDVLELNIKTLEHSKRIAITSGASTPTYLTNQVIEYLNNYPCDKPQIKIQDIL